MSEQREHELARPAPAPVIIEGYLLEPLDPATVDGSGNVEFKTARMGVYAERVTVDAEGVETWFWERSSQITVRNYSVTVSGVCGTYCRVIWLGKSFRVDHLDCTDTAASNLDLTIS